MKPPTDRCRNSQGPASPRGLGTPRRIFGVLLALSTGCVIDGGSSTGAITFGIDPSPSGGATGSSGSTGATGLDAGGATGSLDETSDGTVDGDTMSSGTTGFETTTDGGQAGSEDSSDTGIEEPSPLAPRRVIQGNNVLGLDDAGNGNIKFLFESYCDIVVNDGTCAVIDECDVACPSEASTAAYEHMGVYLGCMDDLFGRDGYDGEGGELRAVIETPTIFGPLWNRNEAMFEATAFNGYTGHPATSLDTVIHEFTHGMILHTSALAHDGSESSALNEGLSDIFASICSWWSKSLYVRCFPI